MKSRRKFINKLHAFGPSIVTPPSSQTDTLNMSHSHLIEPCLEEEMIELFDADAYLQDYPDVRNAFTSTKPKMMGKPANINPLQVFNHYLQFGRNEGRIAYCIRQNGEKVLYDGFNFEAYNSVCESAYYSRVNNELNGYIHYINTIKTNKKPILLHVKSSANVFPEPFKNQEFIAMLQREWTKFDAWKYKKAYGKNGSAKELFIDYVSSNFDSLMAPIKEAKPKVCIIYVYYERKNEQKNQTNLAFFIKYGLDKSRWRDMDITTLFIINGHQCELLIPKMKNVHVLPNENEYDIISYKKGIQYFEKKHNKPFYDIFNSLLIINCGIFGPVYEEGLQRHWLDPYFNKLQKENAVICSPCINFLKDDDAGGPGPRCQSYCSLIKMDKTIYNLLLNTKISNLAIGTKNTSYNLEYDYVLGEKNRKYNIILHGEYGLTRILIENGYNISCLIYDNVNYNDPNVWTHYSDRIDRMPEMSLSNFKSQVFVKNCWRDNQPYIRNSTPCYYNQSIQYAFSKTNMKDVYDMDLKIEYNYDILNIHEQGYISDKPNNPIWGSKQEFYHKFGYAEEHILWPKQKSNNTACVIYCHYDKDNIVKDYVIHALKTLIILDYDIFFCTTCTEIKNVDLPTKIHFFDNAGCGTDFNMINTIFNNEDLSKYQWINLLNDSILLPIHGIENMKNTIQTMRQGNDFWGLYESNETHVHLCSNCLFEISAKCLPVLKSFYNDKIDSCINRKVFIQNIELKQTQHLVENGFTYRGVVSYKDLNHENHSIMFNPKNIQTYLTDPKCFGIKWKYLGNYINYNNLNNQNLNYLMRYLKVGQQNIPQIPNFFEYIYGRPQVDR
jgi:hypothetical protein